MGGEGREPSGTHGARRWPGVSPGSGLTETATDPGSTLTARGGANSLWLQRFACLKLHPLDTVARQLTHMTGASEDWELMAAIALT